MPSEPARRPRVLLLMSGGLDSPVAGWLLKQQGMDVSSVHFSLEPFTDDGPERKSRQAAEALGLGPLRVVRAGECFSELTRRCDHRLYFVLSKRFMLRTASAMARADGFDAIATGENLGQVSSQTLDNLACIHAAADVPLLAPLLGYEKREIVALCERLGVFELVTGPEVCDVLGPSNPRTMARAYQVAAAEARIDVDALTQRALKLFA